jgi:hypothetical protein
MKLKNSAIVLCAAAVLLAGAPAVASLSPAHVHHTVSSATLEKTSAKRFKRGVRRTVKKVRHFLRRAAGKH